MRGLGIDEMRRILNVRTDNTTTNGSYEDKSFHCFGYYAMCFSIDQLRGEDDHRRSVSQSTS